MPAHKSPCNTAQHGTAHLGLTGCGARIAPPPDDFLLPPLHPWLPLSADNFHLLPLHFWLPVLSQAMEFNYFEEVWAAQQELFKVFSQEAMVGR